MKYLLWRFGKCLRLHIEFKNKYVNKQVKLKHRDFDAAESVKEKVNKLLDVKGIKGLRKLMKEIAMTASTGKHDNELIGRTAVTLKVIKSLLMMRVINF